MRLGPSCALWGVCLVLMASGCAGSARREGLATTGTGNLPVRLFRPADPIARLSPAPLSVGPLSDPGSYTAAGVPEMSRPGSAGGALTVGGGQLASRGNAPADRSRSRIATDRPSMRLARTEPIQNPPATRPSPESGEQASESDEGLLARLNGRFEATATRSDRREALSEADVTRPPLEAASDPAVETDRSPLIGSESEPTTPILAEGIDLETYAAPPVSTDPDAQLASTRRPVPALSNARDSLRSESAEDAEESPSEPPTKPIDAVIPDLPDVFPDDPFAEGSDDPFQDVEPAPPAREDEDVRPTSVHPDELASDRSEGRGEPHQEINTPSPFGPARLTDRLGMRVQRLRDRLTPKALREDRSPEAKSSEAKGFPRLFRRQRDEMR